MSVPQMHCCCQEAVFFKENKQMCHKLMVIIDDKAHVLGIHGIFFKICCNGSETTTKIYIIVLLIHYIIYLKCFTHLRGDLQKVLVRLPRFLWLLGEEGVQDAVDVDWVRAW